MTDHVVLLGDSIFDNASYVMKGQSVIEHLQNLLSRRKRASLLAVDGDKADDVLRQARSIPGDATHLALSVGGNDALAAVPLLSAQACSINDALGKLAPVRKSFHRSYRRLIQELAGRGKPLAACTIYENVPGLTEELRTALCLFNDVIAREALAVGARVIDLRSICTGPEDFSSQSPIEPSERGGKKIAIAITTWAMQTDMTQACPGNAGAGRGVSVDHLEIEHPFAWLVTSEGDLESIVSGLAGTFAAGLPCT